MKRRRYAIIIGAMKSGTTTLFDALARHPGIAPARNKEPGFFAFENVWAKGWDWYDDLFDYDRGQHEWCLEASTDYTKTPFVTGVWERMTADPTVEIKLMYIMRHPLRRLESHARHVQTTRKEIGQQISPIRDHALDQGISPVNLGVSMYATQLESYAHAWAKGNLHCLTLEGLQVNPEDELSRVFRFLDLEPETALMDLPRSNRSKDKTKMHPAWGHLTRLQPLVDIGKATIPEAMRSRIKARFSSEVAVKGRFELTEEETALLTPLFREEIRRLSDDYRVDTERYWESGL